MIDEGTWPVRKWHMFSVSRLRETGFGAVLQLLATFVPLLVVADLYVWWLRKEASTIDH